MPPYVDMKGKKCGRLQVIRVNGKDKHGRYCWECRCDCGNVVTVGGHSLRSGNTGSCGCANLEATVLRSTKHGLCGTRVYWTFKSMHNRCSDSKNEDYHLYGGRGIKVCERWRNPEGMADFFADMGMPPEGMSIERIDVNGNYEPGNCVWATPEVQANNKRTNRLITWRNQTRNLSQWCKLLNRNPSWLFKRLKRHPLDIAMAPFSEVVGR